MKKQRSSFVWDSRKEKANIRKHNINFATAAKVFLDPKRRIFTDSAHSEKEPRYFCIGKIDEKIITVRFTYRKDKIRIYGAGLWRKGRKYYEEKKY